VTHTYTRSTIFWVSVTVTDDRGIQQTQTFSQLIYLPPTTARPTNSSNLGVSAGRIWVANADADTISVFAASTSQKLAEIAVGSTPRTLGFAADGSAWVTNEQSGTISVVSPVTLSVTQTIALPYASRPYGISFSPDGAYAYVALAASGRVLKIDAATRSVLYNVSVGANPRHLAVNASGSRVYVSRFISPPLPGEATATVSTSVAGVQKGGEVVVLDTATMTAARTMVLQHSDDMDFENSGSGVPNYLGPLVISPDGGSGWVPSKKDNVRRGTLRSGLNLNFQNTVRAISSRVDLATEAETYAARIDHDNASLASAAAFERYGVFLFVALETSREVAVVDAQNFTEFFRIPVGRAPQGLAVSPDGDRLYVHNFMDRTVGVYDLSKLIDRGQAQVPLIATLQTVGTEKLAANVLKGKQLFYDAFDARLARDRYLSCASCHSDGGGDGRVWDMTGFGEGLRNTIVLNGRAGKQGLLHWTGNFDEVQDFEGQIRTLAGGTGLMSDTAYATGTRSQPLGDAKSGMSTDLDALAAYVGSLNTFAKSPHRNSNGTLTTSGAGGKTLFQTLNCAQCHGGSGFTLSAAGNLKDVGTIKQPTSGQRLGGALAGIDIPTLRDAWSSAPYLHDGSASTIEAAILAHKGVSLKSADLTKLANYVRQIDGDEPALSANALPVVQNPGSQTGRVGVSASLQIQAADPDGDVLGYAASGLPSGLAVNSSTGLISGTPAKSTKTTVTVSVSDGKGGVSKATFTWSISR
jgi:YVTN family beta-propeller protein